VWLTAPLPVVHITYISKHLDPLLPFEDFMSVLMERLAARRRVSLVVELPT
jgi:hypothetical protein